MSIETRAARRAFSALVALASLGMGCGENSSPGTIPPPDLGSSAPEDLGATTPDVGLDVGLDVDAGVPPDIFGLDERPDNSSCRAPPRPRDPTRGIRLSAAFAFASDLERPLALIPLPTRADTYWVVEQAGQIRALTEGGEVSTVADLSARVDDGPNEGGLLGLAFHPRFVDNGRVFVAYTAREDQRFVSRLSEFSSPNRTDLDAGSERVVHQVDQPNGNHNGGALAFGPDARLYYALGDGGGAGDPDETGQNPDSVLGAILRLDVDGEPPYEIPGDNPFASGGGAPEIFAWGFRNPWRFTFDRETGDLWAGDVGQNAIEEVNLVVRGGNYGWNIKEGSQCFDPPTDCPQEGLIDPVAEYPHSEGRSVTGGYVYRGWAIPDLRGAYIYGDFVSGAIWAVRVDPASGEADVRRLLDSGLSIASFAEDRAGELYVLDYGGDIFRLEPDFGPSPSDFPARLSDTGCVRADDPRAPAPGLIPYAPNAPLWSDGARKLRHLALPNNTTIEVGSDGDFDLPIGTVLMKSFLLGETFVETRLFVRHEDGGWAGYSYAWNPEQTDAELLEDDRRVAWPTQDWSHPTRAQCLACHTEAAGRTLGLEIGQLDGEFDYPSTGRRAHQLATWDHIGLFSAPLPPDAVRPRRLPGYAETAPAEDRAKAWLHSNCSVCHRPGGPGRGNMDLRFGTPLEAMEICDEEVIHGTLGVAEPRIVAPGDPDRSMLLLRSLRLDRARMPPLATERLDEVGTELVREWVLALTECP